ncbi:nitrite reductase [Geomonas silvestris]|uniref:Nitrite reductase n=1 Tax=Geomonas silvestris TaxID=2740184 RepID=A0A6V8MFJ7_9BACT|nr:nitrite/sulfite reductase [Geomonas silvestris]GFO58449.1 nitrite reductase [Geomonas silvestris]
MTIDIQKLRLEGIYPQRQKEFHMQRVKLAAGIISSDQALKVAQISERYARGLVHLTTRGSIELHWLTLEDLAPVAAQLASVGLVNRGACGGAVRGVVCGSLSNVAAPELEALARRIHRHFTGNPRFENLPKKFKVGIEADTASGRHLIQDVGLVIAGSEEGKNRFDVYCAGGLGREPQPGFLLAEGVAEESLLPLIETIARLYRENTPPPKRLKYFVRQIGEQAFREMVFAQPGVFDELPIAPTLSARLVPVPQEEARLVARVFAGELSCHTLATLAGIARDYCGGQLMVTGDQNIEMHLVSAEQRTLALQLLGEAGFAAESPRERVTFRVCPGNHECIMGLAPTREISGELLDAMGPAAQGMTWAISGCPNCCAQPQLSKAGVVANRLVKEEGSEERTPRYDLYQADSGPFAEAVKQGLTREELVEAVRQLG